MRLESRLVPLLIVVAAIAVRLLLYSPVFSPDGERYSDQARDLLAHRGYIDDDGDPEVGLPPGYPLFLAVLFAIDGLTLVRIAQIALSSAAALLVWAALRPWSARAALIAGLIVALHPWIAAASAAILSETFALFVCSLLVYLLSVIETKRGNALTFFDFGALCVALLMITPATMFLTFALFVYVAAKGAGRRAQGADGVPEAARVSAGQSPAPRPLRPAPSLFWLTAGALAIMIPWQAQSWIARHRVTPTVFVWQFRDPVTVWTRTWTLRERELHVRWHPRDLAAAPPRAFRSAAERASLLAAARTQSDEQYESTLHDLGAATEAAEPLRVNVVYPAARAALLWLDMPQLGHAQMEYVAHMQRSGNARRDVLRLGKVIVSTLGFAIYAGVAVTLLVLALRRRALAPALIVVTVAIYTAISAYYGDGEARRNLTFYPALLFAAFYARHDSSASTTRDCSSSDMSL